MPGKGRSFPGSRTDRTDENRARQGGASHGSSPSPPSRTPPPAFVACLIPRSALTAGFAPPKCSIELREKLASKGSVIVMNLGQHSYTAPPNDSDRSPVWQVSRGPLTSLEELHAKRSRLHRKYRSQIPTEPVWSERKPVARIHLQPTGYLLPGIICQARSTLG